MPFIEESKYQLMQEDIDNAQLKLEEKEKELSELHENIQHQKQKARTIAVILGLLLGLAIGIIFFMPKIAGRKSDKKIDVAKIKAQEALRIIDSISNSTSSYEDEDLNQENTSIDDDISNIEENYNGQTVYSVQIGIFSKNRHPLISENTLVGIASTNGELFKYSIGLFEALTEAKKMKAELVKIGFQDAFVASYINGERQKIHH